MVCRIRSVLCVFRNCMEYGPRNYLGPKMLTEVCQEAKLFGAQNVDRFIEKQNYLGPKMST
jgi:hypothetical protein